MNIPRKPEKMLQIYWSRKELELIANAVQGSRPEAAYLRLDVLKKCELGIKSIDAYVAGDDYAQALLEVCRAQNETEPMVG